MGRRNDVPAGEIAASVVAGMRHLLIEQGVWESVRAALEKADPGAERALTVDPTKVEWVSAAPYGQMMDALLAVVGETRAFELGRERIHQSAQAGAFAPIVRSWARSFGHNPEEFLRLTTHAWSTQTRGIGTFKLAESRPGRVRFVMADAGRVILEHAGWRRFLCGYGTGLLDLIGRRGSCVISVSSAGTTIDATYAYDDAPATTTGPAARVGPSQ